MSKNKATPLFKFATYKMNEDTVVDIATTKNLTSKELYGIVSSKIFIPELQEKFMEILSDLLLEEYIPMKFKGRDMYYKKTWKWKRKKLYTHPSLGFWGIILAIIAIIVSIIAIVVTI